MGGKRHRLAQRRVALGFTQERLAERMDVDPSTVRRWENGVSETGPKPWLRPKLAQCLQLSLEQLDELLGEEPGAPGTLTPSSESAQSAPGDRHRSAASLGSDRPADVVLPVVIDGRVTLVPIGGDTEDDDPMSPLNRRSALGYGLAAAAAAALAPNGAAQAFHGLTTSSDTSWAAATYEAVLNPVEAMRRTSTAGDDIPDLSALRPMVDHAMRVSLTSDYGALERALPGLLGQVEGASMQSGGDDGAVQQTLSDLYAVAGWTLIKADLPTGAWIAAQRAVQAAEQADDALRVAAATRCLAEVHMRAGNLEAATRTAFLAAVHLEGKAPVDRPKALSLRGAALLSAAAASARRGDGREARAALKAAEACADELGHERSDLATVFGPTNVAIHQVAIPIELGDAREAVGHVPGVQLDRMPPVLIERRSRFLIDVARSYAQVGDDDAAIDALVQAERIAPDELRHHRLTRALIPELLARERRSSELRALAGRCGVLG